MEGALEPRVFVGIDRSGPGLAALRVAVDEARHRGAPLHAVRVQPELTLGAAHEIDGAFTDVFGSVPTDLVIHRELLVGRVADTLTGRARRPSDLLVIGSRGAAGRHVARGGSISRAVLRRARCQVLVVSEPVLDRQADAASDTESAAAGDHERVEGRPRRPVHRPRHPLGPLDA